MDEQKETQKLISQIQKTLSAIEVYQRIIETEQLAPLSELGLIVKAERKKQKVTKEVLSKLAGVSVGTINAIELGKETPSLINIQKVLEALGKSLWIK